MVSSGNVRIFSRLFCKASRYDTLPPPIEPANSESPTIAIVGDSLFAASMGGGNVSYRDALQNNLEKILTLPEETIICPGHGPITTVGEEKQHNPFFVGKV